MTRVRAELELHVARHELDWAERRLYGAVCCGGTDLEVQLAQKRVDSAELAVGLALRQLDTLRLAA